MPIDFEELVQRADGSQIGQMLPPGAVGLLHAIDEALVYPRNLNKILFRLKTPEELLTEPTSRAILLDLLPVDEARVLVLLLGANSNIAPYKYLADFQFSSRKLEILYRFLGIKPVVDEPIETGPSDTEISAQYPLFAHQSTALRKVKALLEREPNRVLLHMPTGAGKTRTAMNIVAEYLRERPKGVVVWLAHSEELCQQAASEFEKAWSFIGNRSIRLARYWGDYDSDLTDLHDGIVVAGLSKAFARLKTDDAHLRAVSGRAPLVVMDEAHQAIAPTYRQIIDLLVRPATPARLLGLTATPGRTWNRPEVDELLSEFFARQKVTLEISGYSNPVKYLIDEGYLASPNFRKISVDSNIDLTAGERRAIEETFDLPKSTLEKLGRHVGRNLQIVGEVEQLVRRHLRVLVFASSLDQSELLAAVLAARGLQVASVSSRNSRAERATALEKYIGPGTEPMVLCNFGVLTTGFDAPRTSAALIARPTLSLVLYSQMIGRALRGVRAGGNAEAEIVTVVDPSIPGFDSVESAFSNWEDVWQER